MSKQHMKGLRGDFLALWRRWTKIVLQFAQRRRSRFELDGAAYNAIHARLLHWCRELQHSQDPKEESLFVEIESVLLPWGSLESLTTVDYRITGDLAARCQQVERLLAGRSVDGTDWMRVAKQFAALAAVAVIVAMLFTWGEPTSWPVVRDILQGARRAAYGVGLTDSVQYLVFGGGAVALVMGLIVWKSAGR